MGMGGGNQIAKVYRCVCVCVCVMFLHYVQVVLDDGHVEFKQNLRKHPEAFNEAASTLSFVCWHLFGMMFDRPLHFLFLYHISQV